MKGMTSRNEKHVVKNVGITYERIICKVEGIAQSRVYQE